jgi:lysophospholipid acyltransferase (LPLAT)-like uncharacterized protein
MAPASLTQSQSPGPRGRRTPTLFKRVAQSRAVRAALCWLISLYIRLVHATSRWQIIGEETPQRLWAEGRPFILAFWHGRLVMMPSCWRTKMPMNMLISQHRDGEIISRTIAHFGLNSVRGSAGNPEKGGVKMAKGGALALRALARSAAAGEALGITPDGPRGPRMRASEGIVAIARLTGLPVLPAAYATSRRRVFNSWDRFILALPFSRGVIVWGEPVQVERNATPEDAERARQAIEDGLNRVTAEADRQVGVPAVEPAPVPSPSRLAEADAR